MGQNLTKVHYNSTIIYFSRILAHFSPALIIVHYNPRENFATLCYGQHNHDGRIVAERNRASEHL